MALKVQTEMRNKGGYDEASWMRTTISNDDLQTVFSALMPAATQWKEIGLALQCPIHQLKLLETKTSGNRDARHLLLDMLDYRQRQGGLGWEDIYHALLVDTVSEKRLAHQIAKDHCPHILCILHPPNRGEVMSAIMCNIILHNS